jgi:hypothetical protein
LLIPIILGEVYEICSSSLFTFLQPPVISPFFRPDSPQHPVLKHRQSIFLPQCQR